MERQQILIVDDHALFREGLAGLLNAQQDLTVVGEAADGLEALQKTRALQPNLVLMDINMPDHDGLDAAMAIKQEMPQVKVMMLTMLSDDGHLFNAIKGGADGYMLKNVSARERLEGIRAISRGEVALSPLMAAHTVREFAREPVRAGVAGALVVDELSAREQEVLRLVASLAGSAYPMPGDLDPAFGSGGKVITDLGGDGGISAMAIQPDGKIVAAGSVSLCFGPYSVYENA